MTWKTRKQASQSVLAIFVISLFIFHPAAVFAQEPLSEIGEPVSQDFTGQPENTLAFSGCTRINTGVINPTFEQRVVELVNQRRSEAGLPPLKRNTDLDYASRYYARDMMDDNYTSSAHDTQDRVNNSLVSVCGWSERIQKFYSNRMYLGENFAAGHQTPEAMMTALMNSPGHRTNILSPDYYEIGVGFVETGGTYGRYWVQDFGRRSNSYPLIINGEAGSTSSQTVDLYLYGQGIWNEMRLRNNSDAWTSWRPFQSSVRWALPAAPGLQTVSVELRRPDGTTTTSSDTILVAGGLGGLPTSIAFIYNQSKGLLSPTYVRLQPTSTAGSVSFNWTASTSAAWIKLSQSSGSSPNSSLTVTPQGIDLNSTQTYTGSITITTASPMPGSPWVIPVQLTVVRDLPYVSNLPSVSR